SQRVDADDRLIGIRLARAQSTNLDTIRSISPPRPPPCTPAVVTQINGHASEPGAPGRRPRPSVLRLVELQEHFLDHFFCLLGVGEQQPTQAGKTPGTRREQVVLGPTPLPAPLPPP